MQRLHRQKVKQIEILMESLKKPGAAEFVMRLFVFALADDLGRNTADDRKIGDVFGNDCPSCNYSTLADFDTWQDCCSWTNKNIIPDFNLTINRIKIFRVNVVVLSCKLELNRKYQHNYPS